MEGSQTAMSEHSEASINAVNELYEAYVAFTQKEEVIKNELLNGIQGLLK